MFRLTLLLMLNLLLAEGFQPFQLRAGVMRSTFWRNKNHLFLAAVDDGGSSKRRKRTKRKSPSQQSSGLEGEISEELLPNSDEEVEMEIKDIRQVVGGVSTIGFVSDAKEEEKTVGRNVLAVDKEVISVGSDTKLDSLEQLLADARRMREATGETEEKDDEISIPNILRNVIQTIVTVDFFFVCVLLLWFLAGIFCSYVLKSDDVQIAFNGIFNPVVQPALGILMIGSAAGAVFKGEDEV